MTRKVKLDLNLINGDIKTRDGGERDSEMTQPAGTAAEAGAARRGFSGADFFPRNGQAVSHTARGLVSF